VSKLLVNPNVLLSPVADGYVAFDVADERLYQLNPFAALLVELCDGSRTPDELAAIVAPLVTVEARPSIRQWLDEASADGLLVSQLEQTDAQGVSIGELGAEELARLADRLRDEGKTQAAFLCQQRAAELCPESSRFLCHLGELAHIVGNREAARAAYERYLQLVPEDAEIQHVLVSLRDDPPPPRVPDACIKQLYERFSTFYESNMCEELGYQGPQHLLDVVLDTVGPRRGLSVLDLGCGTGLAGEALRPLASRLVGVDLSAEMLAKARDRNIYDELAVGELTQWLASTRQFFDLIIACDTFIYFGDLTQVVGPSTRRLNPGGKIAFSVEQAETPPFRLTDSGRYEHHSQHIRHVAGTFEMQVANHREAFLRTEYGREVLGHYVCLT
jgi:predicted TPR repeat methyltransferase